MSIKQLNFKNMKKVILSVVAMAVLMATGCKSETKKEASETTTAVSKEIEMTNHSFGVRGNCGMCKNTIEKAAYSIEGVSKANWDREKKKIDVSFDGDKTNAMEIHKAIAASGYDTEKVVGSKEAYKELPGCCQYSRDMIMNPSDETKD